jgi:hypothetical protein
LLSCLTRAIVYMARKWLDRRIWYFYYLENTITLDHLSTKLVVRSLQDNMATVSCGTHNDADAVDQHDAVLSQYGEVSDRTS